MKKLLLLAAGLILVGSGSSRGEELISQIQNTQPVSVEASVQEQPVVINPDVIPTNIVVIDPVIAPVEQVPAVIVQEVKTDVNAPVIDAVIPVVEAPVVETPKPEVVQVVEEVKPVVEQVKPVEVVTPVVVEPTSVVAPVEQVTAVTVAEVKPEVIAPVVDVVTPVVEVPVVETPKPAVPVGEILPIDSDEDSSEVTSDEDVFNNVLSDVFNNVQPNSVVEPAVMPVQIELSKLEVLIKELKMFGISDEKIIEVLEKYFKQATLVDKAQFEEPAWKTALKYGVPTAVGLGLGLTIWLLVSCCKCKVKSGVEIK